MKSHVPSKGGGPTPAVTAAAMAGIDYIVHRYDHDEEVQSYGGEAADAMERLGVEAARVYKTLVASADGRFVMVLVAVTAEVDLKALALALGAKRAEMAAPADAERATGYLVGGISPLGGKRALRTVVDAGASAWGTIFVSGGRRGLELELAPGDLVRLSGAVVAHVAR